MNEVTVYQNARNFNVKEWLMLQPMFITSAGIKNCKDLYHDIFTYHTNRYWEIRGEHLLQELGYYEVYDRAENQLQFEINVKNILRKKFYNTYHGCNPPLFHRVLISNDNHHHFFRQTMDDRRAFRKDLKKHKLTYKMAAEELLFRWPDNISSMRDNMLTEQLPEELTKRYDRRQRIRAEISKVAMRNNIPSDLVPTICAYAVPHSKIYSYM